MFSRSLKPFWGLLSQHKRLLCAEGTPLVAIALASMSIEKDVLMEQEKCCELNCTTQPLRSSGEDKEEWILFSNKQEVWRWVSVSPTISFVFLICFYHFISSVFQSTAGPACSILVLHILQNNSVSILVSMNSLFCYHLVGVVHKAFICLLYLSFTSRKIQYRWFLYVVNASLLFLNASLY